METQAKYRVFKRSATNWEQFSSARKVTVRRGLTYSEAQQMCTHWNDHERTPREIKIGRKMEFEAE